MSRTALVFLFAKGGNRGRRRPNRRGGALYSCHMQRPPLHRCTRYPAGCGVSDPTHGLIELPE